MLPFERSGEPNPEPAQQASAERRFHSWCWSFLGPHRCLCWQANTHTYPSLSRHSLWGCDIQCNSLCGLSEAWFYIYLPSPAALSLTGSYDTYTHMQQKPLASTVFCALYTHTGTLFSLVCNLWIWDVLAKSSQCLGDVCWRKSRSNCPVLWSWTEPYPCVPGARAGQ